MSTFRLPMPSGPAGRRSQAFTLVELLVSMGVIALLAALLLPALTHARHQARDSNCKNHLTQMWKCVAYYVGPEKTPLFPNLFPALRMSNILYKDGRITGFGYAIPHYLEDFRRVLYCPDDPVRNPEWEFGWQNWEIENGEVQCSYGYRGGQGIVADPTTPFTLSDVDRNPQKVFITEYYETFTTPRRINHLGHINVLRCNGSVDQVSQVPEYVSFGPNPADFEHALEVLDSSVR
jgi:prepilin-type N-terminal cleavage/methylation domain-containing protein